MADRIFDDWSLLADAAQAQLDKVLAEDVAPLAKRILQEHIQADIYDAYTPEFYDRREGLISDVQMYLVGPGEIMVTSPTSANSSLIPGYTFENRYPGAFLEMLEVGNMGFWRRDFPRPAVGNAQDEIDKSREIAGAIRAGLKRGFEM